MHKYRHKPIMARKFLESAYITMSPSTYTHTLKHHTQKNWDNTMLSPSSRTLLQVFSVGSSGLCHRSTCDDTDGRGGTMTVGQSEMFPAYIWPVSLHLRNRVLRSMIAPVFMIASPVT